MKFSASVVHLGNDGYTSELAFADDRFDPVNHVSISFTNEPTAQDIALGFQHLYIEAPGLDGYGLVRRVALEGTLVRIELNDGRPGFSEILVEIPDEKARELENEGAVEAFNRRV